MDRTRSDPILPEFSQFQKLRCDTSARILKNSAFDAPSSPIIKNLVWMKIADLISFESNQLVFKQAPQYICKCRNTATDMRLPMYTSSNGQNVFLTA